MSSKLKVFAQAIVKEYTDLLIASYACAPLSVSIFYTAATAALILLLWEIELIDCIQNQEEEENAGLYWFI